MHRHQSYPSDVSREQFERIRPLLESARKKTKPRHLDLYELFCGVLYVLKGGIQWRMLPRDFPKWGSVYAYWQKWSEQQQDGKSVLDKSLKKIGWRGPHAPWAQTQNHALYY